MIATTIAHYRVEEKLGEGGMGEVYLADDTSLQRKVALKVLPEFLQKDEAARKRFLREARSAAAINHPYICNIHEVIQSDEGQSLIVMEYVEGQTFKEKLPVPYRCRRLSGLPWRWGKPCNWPITAGSSIEI